MAGVIEKVKQCNPLSEWVSVKGVFYRQSWTTPATVDNTSVHAAVTLPATGTTVVTTGITNPGVARVVRIKGNASGIAGNVVVVGKDQFGAAQTDTIALSGASAVDGVIAFASVSSITFPAKTNSSGDTVSVGAGQALGLERRPSDAFCFYGVYNGVVEGTVPTIDTTHNTASLNTSLGGDSVVVAFPHNDVAHL